MVAFDIPWCPSARTLRQFSSMWLIATGFLTWRFGVADGSLAPMALIAAAVAIGIGGWLWPWTIRPLFTTLMVLTAPIGWVVSHVLLALVFYGLFMPIGLLFRILGREALERRFESNSDTYWQPKVMPTDPARYLRTF